MTAVPPATDGAAVTQPAFLPLTGRPGAAVRHWWPVAAAAAGILAVIVLGFILDAGRPDFANALQPPSSSHLAGSDHFGHDLLARTVTGLRTSLAIAAVCALLSAAIGAAIGVAAASWGGWFDAIVMRLVDGVNALPHLVLGLVIAAMWRGALVAIIASIALTHWPAVARVVRAELLSARHSGWIEQARLAGASRWFIARHHLLGAVTGQLLVALIVLVPHAIWHESTLSFLGVGLSPESASLGALLNSARGDVLTGAWWTLAVPGIALIVAALGCAAATTRIRAALTPPEGLGR
ncbi:ABC transporter permease [Gordonia phosphorivorans]|uniref:ABC transporter permease n=1 Tax=Gordonia phosphorivorans TaxID=1056982 RepID=A0ABV6H7X4_9ACTN